MSMTSEVMERRRGAVESSDIKALLQSADSAQCVSLHLCREETFNAQFLQCNILRCAEGGKRRKQAKRRVLPPVVNGQERWRSAIQIEHAPGCPGRAA